MKLSSNSVYVEKIEKRVGSGIWVTARNGGDQGPSVVYNTTQKACPVIGMRLVVTVELPED